MAHCKGLGANSRGLAAVSELPCRPAALSWLAAAPSVPAHCHALHRTQRPSSCSMHASPAEATVDMAEVAQEAYNVYAYDPQPLGEGESKHVISVFVADESGMINRVAGVFARRGVNIESLAVGLNIDKALFTIALTGTDPAVANIVKQLAKLVKVRYVEDITDTRRVERELVLLKLNCPPGSQRTEVMQLIEIFRARVIDVSDSGMTVCVTGDAGKTMAMQRVLAKFGIAEIARTGKISLKRGDHLLEMGGWGDGVERRSKLEKLQRHLQEQQAQQAAAAEQQQHASQQADNGGEPAGSIEGGFGGIDEAMLQDDEVPMASPSSSHVDGSGTSSAVPTSPAEPDDAPGFSSRFAPQSKPSGESADVYAVDDDEGSFEVESRLDMAFQAAAGEADYEPVTLSILVDDIPGVLNQVTGVIARRGYNIQSLAVGTSETEGLSRITIVIPGTPSMIQKLTRQILKLISVSKVVNLTAIPFTQRELMLVKVRCKRAQRGEIRDLADVFHGTIADVGPNTITVEIQGKDEKMGSLQELLAPYGILEIARTGRVALSRDSGINTQFLQRMKLQPLRTQRVPTLQQ
ncbi:hypothetical protein WJX74_008743 [Apatococcus lobatus]|uniref:ACT domain-containing protein n=1 Tax=Apatococcus lobatus TaxID=904363 RepID=A0AAW1SGG5_9CHLO